MKKNSGKKPVPARNRKKPLVLVIVLAAAVALGAWLFIAPRLEARRLADHTAALLESIERGDGTLPVDSAALEAAVDFYDTDSGGDVITLFWDGGEAAAAEAAPEDSAVITGIGVLTIEKIDLTMPVSNGVSEAQLKVSAGWVPQTAPVGETGNAVIAGHRNYTYGSHFNRLGELEAGDEIAYRSIDGESMVFIVSEILEIAPGDQAAFAQPEDAQMLTLYTCTPIHTATHRLLVRALRVQ